MSLRTSCGIADIGLYFEESEIAVSPFELDVMKDEGQLDYARGRISREAGDLIQEKVESREPVQVWSGPEGDADPVLVARLFLPDDGLELNTEDAHLRLQDELNIFQYIQIDKSFSGSWTLGEIIDYIFDRVEDEDPHNILKEWTDSDVDIGQDSWTVDGAGGFISMTPIAGTIAEGLTSAARNRIGFLQEDMDIAFDGESGIQAISEIAAKFNVDVFTKDDGVMYVGSQEDDVDFFIGSFDRRHYNLINYSVPVGNNKIKEVVAKGGLIPPMASGVQSSAWDLLSGDILRQTRGYARRIDIDEGDTIVINVDSSSPERVSQVAEDYLKHSVGEDKSGNCTVDVLSTNFSNIHRSLPDIRDVSVDDVIIVPDHEGMCQNIVPGSYFIDSIQHRINPRVGWTVQLGLKKMLLDEVVSGAYTKNMLTGELSVDFGDIYTYIEELEMGDEDLIEDVDDT